jgi:hypothetical protein
MARGPSIHLNLRRFACTGQWLWLYGACAVFTAAGVAQPGASWLCAVSFAAAFVSIVLHVVRASLTRHVLPIRLTVGLNVVVLGAASLGRDRLTTQALAAIVAAVPLLSYFCLCGYFLALAPPRPGEAMRAETTLRQCHPLNRLTVFVVLTVEVSRGRPRPPRPAAEPPLHSLCASRTLSTCLARVRRVAVCAVQRALLQPGARRMV